MFIGEYFSKSKILLFFRLKIDLSEPDGEANQIGTDAPVGRRAQSPPQLFRVPF